MAPARNTCVPKTTLPACQHALWVKLWETTIKRAAVLENAPQSRTASGAAVFEINPSNAQEQTLYLKIHGRLGLENKCELKKCHAKWSPCLSQL
jgi:hypothetical protein